MTIRRPLEILKINEPGVGVRAVHEPENFLEDLLVTGDTEGAGLVGKAILFLSLHKQLSENRVV